jgi:hypothetical protein
MYVDRCRNSRRQEYDSKRSEKILKYKDLTIEIQRMWNIKTRVIPVIIGATGTISKSFRKYVSTIPGNYEVKELLHKGDSIFTNNNNVKITLAHPTLYTDRKVKCF